MELVGSTVSHRPFFTKRKVYFFGLLLPLLVPVAGVGLAFYLPWLAIHCWRARRRETRDLILDAWKIPFRVAALTLVETIAYVIFAWIYDGRRQPFFEDLPWGALGFFPGFALACGLGYLFVGWVLLFATVKWPLDAKNPSPYLFMRR